MRRDRHTRVESDRVATEVVPSSDAVQRLDCRIEDGADGPKATLFPVDADGDELVTRWLTADETDVVSLADWR